MTPTDLPTKERIFTDTLSASVKRRRMRRVRRDEAKPAEPRSEMGVAGAQPKIALQPAFMPRGPAELRNTQPFDS